MGWFGWFDRSTEWLTTGLTHWLTDWLQKQFLGWTCGRRIPSSSTTSRINPATRRTCPSPRHLICLSSWRRSTTSGGNLTTTRRCSSSASCVSRRFTRTTTTTVFTIWHCTPCSEAPKLRVTVNERWSNPPVSEATLETNRSPASASASAPKED